MNRMSFAVVSAFSFADQVDDLRNTGNKRLVDKCACIVGECPSPTVLVDLDTHDCVCHVHSDVTRTVYHGFCFVCFFNCIKLLIGTRRR